MGLEEQVIPAQAQTADEVTLTGVSGTIAIKAGGVTNSYIGAKAVKAANIDDATITVTQLANNAVETAKIKDGAVTNAKLAFPFLSVANLTALTAPSPGAATITFTVAAGTIPAGCGIVFECEGNSSQDSNKTGNIQITLNDGAAKTFTIFAWGNFDSFDALAKGVILAANQRIETWHSDFTSRAVADTTTAITMEAVTTITITCNQAVGASATNPTLTKINFYVVNKNV